MATSYTSLLGFALPVTGELDGTWGTTVNNSITELVEDSIAATATASVTSGDWTLTTTGSGAVNQARCAILIPTGTPGVSRNIIAPGQSKAYIVVNQSDAAVVLKASATTGATIAAGIKALAAWNGSDFVVISSTSVNDLSGTLPVSKGGTGNTTIPARSLFVANTLDTITTLAPSAGQSIRINAGNTAWEAYTPSTGTGDVTGPASSTANAIPTFNGTGGKTLQNNAAVTISAGIITASGFTGPVNGTVGATTPNTGVFTDVTLNAQGDVRFADSDSSNWVAFQGPATVTSNVTWTLPSTDGTNGQALVTNGSGTLSWTTAGSPAVGALQYFAGTTSTSYPGSGWLLCDGSTVSQATYPTLYSRLGLMWTGFGTPTGAGGLQSGTTSNITSVAAGNNTFMYRTQTNPVGGRYSNTGITWSDAGSTGGGGTVDLTTSIIYGDIYFAGSRYNSGGFYPQIATTTNGVTWTQTDISASINGGALNTQLTGIGYAGDKTNKYLFWANDGRIYTTSNFTTYTQITLSPSPSASTTTTNAIIPYANNVYLNFNSGNKCLLYTSTNLTNYTQRGSGLLQEAQNTIATKGNGLFVAAAGSNSGVTGIETSTDRITWTNRTNSLAGNVNALFYASNSRFVILSSGNYFGTSTDGITWVRGTYPGDSGYNLIFDGTLYIGCNQTGGIWTSTNGINSTARTSGTTSDLFGLAYASDKTNKYIVAGDGGVLLSSTDAITWTARTSNSTSNLRSAAYGNGRFAVVANTALLTSTDAVTWETQTNRFPDQSAGMYYSSKFYNTDLNAAISSSTDAITWTTATNNSKVPLASYPTYSDGVFIQTYMKNVMTSTDTVTWTNSSGIIVLGRDAGTGSTYIRTANNRFFQIPFGSGNWTTDYAWGPMATSTDGVYWEYLPTLNTITSPRDITYGNGRYAIAAASGTVWTSTDLVSFTSYTGLSTSTFVSISYTSNTNTNGQSFVAAGVSGSMASSTDGITWSVFGLGTGSTMNRIVKGSDKFVMVGNSGAVLTSVDGETNWTIRTSGTSSNLNVVAFGGGLYVAGGAGGDIRTSTNGINWTTRTSGTTSIIRGIAYAGDQTNKWIYGGDGGVVRSSTDAITWTSRTSGTTSIIRDAEYFAGSFWIMGDGGMMRSSSDAITWEFRTSALVNQINSMAYNPSRGDRFIVVGDAGTIATSVDGITWTAIASGTSSNLIGVCAYNNYYFATGVSVALTSGEGGVWSQRAISGSAGTYNTCIFANNKFQAYGANAVMSLPGFYSYNTATEFVLPTQSTATNVSDGSTPVSLYIRAT